MSDIIDKAMSLKYVVDLFILPAMRLPIVPFLQW